MTDVIDENRPTAPTLTLEDLRGRTPEELYELIPVIDGHLRSLHQDERGGIRELDQAEQAAFDQLMQVRQRAEELLEEHRRVAEVFRRRPRAVEVARANIGYREDDPYADVRRLTNAEVRDRALKRLDDRQATRHLKADEKDQVERLVRRSPDISRRILITENEHYRSAWMKLMTQPFPFLDDDERKAMQAWEEYRAAGETVVAAGGYGVPVFIDPSIILTAQGSGNPFLQIARQVDVNTNIWKGVSSAGVTWSFDTEAGVVSDDAPTLAQPSVQVHMARGFIPFSIEIGDDYPGFAQEMATLLAEGYDELLVDKFTRGSGTGEPQGVLTILSATAGARVKLTTAGAVGAPDPYKVWKSLGQRFRRRASWLMSVDTNNAIRQLGTANVYHASTVDLTQAAADVLFQKPVYESPYMPDTTTLTTIVDGLAVVGDFSNYLIARRGGMNTELVPHLIDVTNGGLPRGQRGWFSYARIGAGVVNTSAFKLLVNS